jgi:hypothetical protein
MHRSEPFRACSRHKFTPDEDLQLRSLVERFGTKNWEEIARMIPARSARQCRDRYKNYLTDTVIPTPWTPEEDKLLIEKFHQIGPKWVEIGKLLSGRSGNNVKNRWHKHLCKMDVGRPRISVEHKPVMDLGRAIGWSDQDWRELFGGYGSPLQFAAVGNTVADHF